MVGYAAPTVHTDGPIAPVLDSFLQHCPTIARAFAVEYRLLCPGANAAHPFPTAPTDASAGYTYLGNLGSKKEDFVLRGDSAGGNLALALIRYLTENWDGVPHRPQAPGALAPVSPWDDVNESFEVTRAESTT